MAKPQTQQDYWDMGADTERWWREHVRSTIPHLRHVSCKGYDFRGVFEENTLLVDVKFYTVPYREKGWIEVKTWGNVTGIMQSAKEHYNNPKTDVYLAVLIEGQHYFYDVKEIIRDIQKGILPIIDGTCTDNMGNVTPSKSVKLDGWNDSRYLIFQGPMKKDYWKPQTAFGKGMDMDKWFKGEGI